MWTLDGQQAHRGCRQAKGQPFQQAGQSPVRQSLCPIQ
ncbi:MAG: hypothetical protein RLZZ157_524 [Pseudomonadota bacterium]|jgi:hypothetical protein